METKLTIGLPVYNADQYIASALDSLINQTYQNFVIIISDNASTDKTEIICRSYAEKDNRIKYIRQRVNIGMKNNFISLLKYAETEYFMWAASDDLWNKDFIKILISHLENNKKSISAFCPYVYFNENMEFEPNPRIHNFSKNNRISSLLNFLFYRDPSKDVFLYGIHRTKEIKEINFLNRWPFLKNYIVDLAYPACFYILAKGKLDIIETHPLWYGRKFTKIGRHGTSTLIKRNLKSCIISIMLLINLVTSSIFSVYRASRSIFLTIIFLPFAISYIFLKSIRIIIFNIFNV